MTHITEQDRVVGLSFVYLAKESEGLVGLMCQSADSGDTASSESSSGSNTSLPLHIPMSPVVLSQTVPLRIPLPVMILMTSFQICHGKQSRKRQPVKEDATSQVRGNQSRKRQPVKEEATSQGRGNQSSKRQPVKEEATSQGRGNQSRKKQPVKRRGSQ